MIALLLVAQFAMAAPAKEIDSLPVITLDEALSRSVRLNPNYVRALSTVAEADWIRKTARVAFFIPAVSATLDYTKYSQAFFNIGTFNQSSTSSTFQATATYELLSARKFTELGRTAAQLENAQATEAQQRYAAALLTESAYYAVISDAEFAQVERDRVARAEAQLALARARVASGAAVQSDSLTVVLELVRARSSLLSRESQLRVSRLELGRRVGTDGPVDAAPLDTLVPVRLPLGLPEAVMQALQQGPEYRAARSAERAAEVALSGRRGAYLPILTLTAAHARFDEHIFPSASNVSSITITASLPLWDNGQRELAIIRARSDRDVARAIRTDLELAAQRDVTEAYDGYSTARAQAELAFTAKVAARENYRVQEARYRSGATTVLDLLLAQSDLSDAESQLVQARYAARLARALLESILGTRFDSIQGGSQ